MIQFTKKNSLEFKIAKSLGLKHEVISAPLSDGTNPEDLPLLHPQSAVGSLSQLPDSIPGQLPEVSPISKIPDWYKIGWAAQIESADLFKTEQDEARHMDILESFLSDVYYGTWSVSTLHLNQLF